MGWDGRIKKWKIRVHKFVENELQKGDRININRKRKIFGAPVTQTRCTIPKKRAKIFNYVDLDAPVVEDNLDGPFVDNQVIEEQTSKDSSYFKSQCANILGEILESKQSKPTKSKASITEVKTETEIKKKNTKPDLILGMAH